MRTLSVAAANMLGSFKACVGYQVYLMKWQMHVNLTAMDENVPELPSTRLMLVRNMME